jgi:hypothetical protein
VSVRERPDLLAAANAAIKALKAVNGAHFGIDFGKSPYCGEDGTSSDNAHQLGVKYAYTLELRDSPRGTHGGFILPANQIVPSGKEVVEGMLALWSYAELHQ